MLNYGYLNKPQEECAKEFGWNILAAQSGEFTQAKGQEVMESLLKQYDNINVVYCENDNEAFGAIDAIEEAMQMGADALREQMSKQIEIDESMNELLEACGFEE